MFYFQIGSLCYDLSMYYKTRKSNNSDFEEQYWGVVRDPDGVVRNKSQEKNIYLNDIKEEIAFINSLPAGKVLDIGCGLGFLLSGLDKKFDKHGLEVSKLACDYAKEYCNVYNSTLEDAKFNDNEFDIIIMYHVIEHIEKPETIIKEVKRILKPNGYFIIGTPDFDCFCAKRFKDNFRLLHDKTHISLFSKQSLTKFLIDYDFHIKKKIFPYFKTRHFTVKNLLRLIDTSKVSPPFYGNVMTFCCKNKK